MAFGGLAALWDPNEHPRGFHGRFIRKFKLAPWLDKVLRNFNPRQWHSDGQAGQYSFNQGHKSPAGAFSSLDMKRIHGDWDEAQDHIRHGDSDPTTKAFDDVMQKHMQNTPEALIVGRTFGPDGLGLTPEQLNQNDPNGITRFMGNTLVENGYSAGHVGSNLQHGPGKITMSLAVPAGTRMAFSGQNAQDRGVFLDKGQKVLVTQVNPDGRGGWYMMGVVEPNGSTSGSPTELMPGRKGANLSEEQRAARIGAGAKEVAAPNVAEPPRAPTPVANIQGRDTVLPGPAQAPTPEKAAAKAVRGQKYQQARAAEEQAGGIPQGAVPPEPTPAPQAAPQPQPVPTTPGPPAPSVGARTEPVHAPIGGVSTEGKSASEIANTPTPPPALTPAAPEPHPATTFRAAFHDAGIEYPSPGKERVQLNKVFLGLASGKMHPQDGIRQLESDIKHNEGLLSDPSTTEQRAKELRGNIAQQKKFADLVAQHFNVPREGKVSPTPPEHLGVPEAPSEPAPVKKAARAVKKAAPAAPEAAPAPVKAVEKAAPEATPAAPSAEKATVSAARVKPGDKLLVRKNDKGEWGVTTTKTGATPITVTSKESGAGAHVIVGKDAAGNEIRTHPIRGQNVLRRHIEPAPKAPRATKVAKAAEAAPEAKAPEAKAAEAKAPFTTIKSLTPEERKQYDALSPEGRRSYLARRRAGRDHANALGGKAPEATPAPAKAAKATAAKVAKAAPAAKAVNEVQTRADEAGLPKLVKDLRAQAREKKIRGFSTMSKEQLQRALLGEDVGTGGGKLGAIAPDKLTPHLLDAKTDQAASNLLEDHTVADLKALAKHNGVDLKGITTKDRIKDAVIKHLRGEEPGALRPGIPEQSLKEQMRVRGQSVPSSKRFDDIRSIVEGGDENSPDSLRSRRDELEKIAQDAKVSDPDVSKVAQDAADGLGMRAQEISGVEEAPTPTKAVKAVKKAAAAKLSVHQERVRKQAIADGASEEEARAAGEAAPVRAPAGTKAASAAKVAAKKAEGLPGTREAGTPGPKLAAPTRAPKAGERALARENIPNGAQRVQPQGVRETAAPGAPFTPESERKLRAAGITPGQLGAGRPDVAKLAKEAGIPGDGGGLVPAAQLDLNQGLSEKETADRLRRQAKRLTKEFEDGIKSNPPKDKLDIPGLRQQSKENTDKIENLANKIEGKPTKRTPAQIAEGKKVVPEGSVKGERAQTPIDNNARKLDFDRAYADHIKTRSKRNLSPSTITSMDEVQNDVSTGKYSPEEGIRRIESDISFNREEADGISRDLRAGNLTGEDAVRAKAQRNQLLRNITAQEDQSRFMHQHFGKERVTPEEVKSALPATMLENIQKTDPEALKEAMRADPSLAHITPRGDTGGEVFDNAIKDMITHRLGEIAAEKEAKKVAKKAAPGTVGPARTHGQAPKPEFEPGGTKHLDAKAIAGDLPVEQRRIDAAQADLNAGKSPTEVAKRIRDHSTVIRSHNAFVGLGKPDGKLTPQQRADIARADQEAKHLDDFADRIEATKRPRAPRAAKAVPEKSTVTEVKEAKVAAKATGTPVAEVKQRQTALKKAEAAASQAGLKTEADNLKQRILKRHTDAWEAAKNRQSAEAATTAMRQDLTLPEIREWAKPQGITGRSKDDILKKAVDLRFGDNTNFPGENRRVAVANRMERFGKTRDVATALAEIEELNNNQASDRVLDTRIKNRGVTSKLDEPLTNRLMANARNQRELDKIAKEHGLVRNSEPAGAAVPFDPKRMVEIGGEGKEGQPVRVISPGFEGEVDGRKFQAVPAKVQREPEAKAEMEQGLLSRRERIAQANPAETPAATRTAVAERLTRSHAANVARVTKKAAPAAAPGKFNADEVRANLAKATTREQAEEVLKGLTVPELKKLNPNVRGTKAQVISELITAHSNVPTVGQMAKNLASEPFPTGPSGTVAERRVAKAVPTVTLPHRQTPAQIAKQLETVTTTEEGNKILSTLPKSKAQYKAMADHVGVETASSDTIAKMHDAILRQAVTRRLEHAAYLRRAQPASLTGPETEVKAAPVKKVTKAEAAKAEEEKAAKAFEVLTRGGHRTSEPAPTPTSKIPATAPVRRAHARFDENTSASTFGRDKDPVALKAPNGSWSSDQGIIHMDSQIGQLWQDFAKDDRVSNAQLNKIATAGRELHSGEKNLNQVTAELNTLRNDLPEGGVRDRLTEAVRDLSGPKKPDVNVPDNTPQSVKDWLEKVADTPTFNKAIPGRPLRNGKTPFEELQDVVKEVSEGQRPLGAETKLAAITNMHESTDGYYALRREAGKVFSTPEAMRWFRTRPTEGQPEATHGPRTASVEVTPPRNRDAALARERAAKAEAAPVKAARAAKKVAPATEPVKVREASTPPPTHPLPPRPTKATKKAAPAKVTQAELKNPVEKVGNVAPVKAATNVTATGLTPGDGLPTANLLAIKNKLGPGKGSTLTQLDTALRIQSRHDQVPALFAKLQNELAQAGIGQNDEPRKTLIAWFNAHFK